MVWFSTLMIWVSILSSSLFMRILKKENYISKFQKEISKRINAKWIFQEIQYRETYYWRYVYLHFHSFSGLCYARSFYDIKKIVNHNFPFSLSDLRFFFICVVDNIHRICCFLCIKIVKLYSKSSCFKFFSAGSHLITFITLSFMS